MKQLKAVYKNKKQSIKKRLNDFSNLHKGKDEDIFSELCFCILTPQSKAVYCDEAVKELKKSNALFKGTKAAIRSKLKRVRFPNNKASYLIEARNFLGNGNMHIKDRLGLHDIFKTREWLVKNIKGLGFKEASHFLRNIGLGKNIAILDVHILRNLKKYKVINKIPSSITKKHYLEIEGKMIKFGAKIGIPAEELDLLFWSNQTGFIFK